MLGRLRALRLRLLWPAVVCVWVFGAVPVELWHLDDAPTHSNGLALVSHDATDHRLGAGGARDRGRDENCSTCQWLRSLHSVLASLGFAPTPRDDVDSLPPSPDPAREVACSRLPARSPPV
jgi:hypothetical protein